MKPGSSFTLSLLDLTSCALGAVLMLLVIILPTSGPPEPLRIPIQRELKVIVRIPAGGADSLRIIQLPWKLTITDAAAGTSFDIDNLSPNQLSSSPNSELDISLGSSTVIARPAQGSADNVDVVCDVTVERDDESWPVTFEMDFALSSRQPPAALPKSIDTIFSVSPGPVQPRVTTVPIGAAKQSFRFKYSIRVSLEETSDGRQIPTAEAPTIIEI